METREFVKLQEQFALTNTVIVGISTDSVERLQRFGEAQDVTFPLVSDSTASVARLYDVRRRFGLGTSRVTYVIDREGLVRDVHHNELSTSGHARRSLRRLKVVLQAGKLDDGPG